MADSLAPEVVLPLLRGRFGKTRYVFAERCPSTQRLLSPDDPEGALAVAEEQTEGRGRLGRSWHAPAGTSILCSVLLRPAADPARLPEISVVAGEAVAETIGTLTSLEPTIKLPNDVLVGGRKTAGILAEANDGRVVLGIGVNVHQSREQLPADADPPATSLRIEGAELERPVLLAELLVQLEQRYEDWLRAQPN